MKFWNNLEKIIIPSKYIVLRRNVSDWAEVSVDEDQDIVRWRRLIRNKSGLIRLPICFAVNMPHGLNPITTNEYFFLDSDSFLINPSKFLELGLRGPLPSASTFLF